MKRLLDFLKPNWKLFAGLMVTNFALAGMVIALPLITKEIVDKVFIARKFDVLSSYITVILIVFLLKSVIAFLFQYGKEILGQRILTTVRTALYRKFLLLPYSFYDTAQTGQLMSRMTNDVDATRVFLSSSLIDTLNLVISIFWVYAAFMAQDLRLAAISGLMIALLGVAVNMIRAKLTHAWYDVHKQNAELSTFLQENLAGYRVVKAFARERDEIAKFRKINKRTVDINYKTARLGTGLHGVSTFANRTLQLIVLGIGGMMVSQGRLTLGTLVASLGLMRELIGPVTHLGQQLNSFSQTYTAGLRVFEILDEPCPIQSPPNPVQTEEIKGWLEFQDVFFAYKNMEKHALHGVSFCVPPGTSLGIMGETGSGKSTLINLLGRFYDPVSGAVLVDGIDVRDMELSLLRKNLGYVSQEPLLFSSTIKDNIAFGSPRASMEEIVKAAKLAQIHDFIASLPDEYETELGERGIGLSGGQKQRLAIARAFLINPKILVLDDCTSAVDAETELLLKEAINNVMKRRTTIIISNRISAVKDADQIIVLNEGRILERGSHMELLGAEGFYYRTYCLQSMKLLAEASSFQ
ncbi:MAG: ABC transporter ATP-binding protein [Bacillota bacterium]